MFIMLLQRCSFWLSRGQYTDKTGLLFLQHSLILYFCAPTKRIELCVSSCRRMGGHMCPAISSAFRVKGFRLWELRFLTTIFTSVLPVVSTEMRKGPLLSLLFRTYALSLAVCDVTKGWDPSPALLGLHWLPLFPPRWIKELVLACS